MNARVAPLDRSVLLADVVRALALESTGCAGVWLTGARRLRHVVVGPPSRLVLVPHADLGALLSRVSLVAVQLQDRIVALPSRVLALSRVLDVVTCQRAAPCSIRLDDRSPEQVLAERRAAGSPVLASRVRYELGFSIPLCAIDERLPRPSAPRY